MTAKALKYSVDGNIAVVMLDSPPVNALGYDTRVALDEGFRKAWADDSIEAIVLICGGRTFIAGADISEFGKEPRGPDLVALLGDIEFSKVPVVAAIHGTALGGGLETALMCHYRIAVPSAKVGLPEVHLGLLPGAGGTQRLPRIVGPEIALDMITGGKPIGAKKALEYGVIDAIAEEGKLLEDAVAFAKKIVADKAPLVRIRDRQDKVEPYRSKMEIFDAFRKKKARAFRGFKAPENIIKAIEAAVQLPFEEGDKREKELFRELVTSDESAAQRYVFFAERATAKVPGISKDIALRPLKKIGVIGAGTMGGGITMNFLSVGIPVTLVEVKQEALDRGVSVIRKNYENTAAKGRMSQEQVEACMKLITPSLHMEDLANCDLIIEAVFESMPIKEEVFGKLDKIARKGAILASNTSFLDLNRIAAATTRPEEVIGLHFFSPANVMPLLEIVRGGKTKDDILATALDLAKRIGKTPVVSGVCDGFIANRSMRPRTIEAERMMLQGVDIQRIDKVVYDYGFAMGPFQMTDLVGLDVLGRDSNEKTVRSELVRHDRLGQKKNGGYYDYDENRKQLGVAPLALQLIKEISAEQGVKQVGELSDEDILARLLYPVINQGAQILEEKIALRGSDIDIALIKGYNWPVYRGGPMFWADLVGLPKIVAKMRELEKELGEEFKPAALLVKLAETGGSLHEYQN